MGNRITVGDRLSGDKRDWYGTSVGIWWLPNSANEAIANGPIGEDPFDAQIVRYIPPLPEYYGAESDPPQAPGEAVAYDDHNTTKSASRSCQS